VDIGDVVKEGDLLAEIETPEIVQEFVQAEANLMAAQARLKIAEISAQRWEELYKRNAQSVPLQEVDERTTSLQTAQGEFAAAQAAVDRLKAILEFNQIRAPFSGTITARNIDWGALVTSGSNGFAQKLFDIAKVDVLRVFVDVPQPYFRLIRDGMQASVAINEFPGEVFRGIVVRNAGALEPLARTLLTEVHINNTEGRLVSGLFTYVHFSLVPDTSYFIIPTKALIIRSGKPTVALVKEGEVAHLIPVKLGRDWGKTIEVVEGLENGDRLITNPTDRILNGTLVKVSSDDSVV
jgi:RND family efflux transporter MFP subunit